MIQARSLLMSLSDAELGALVRTELDEDLARRLMLGALNATLEASPKERPTEALRRASRAPRANAAKPKPQTGGGAPVQAVQRRTRAPGETAELIYRVIIGADEPLAPADVAKAVGLHKTSAINELTKLIKAKRIFKARSGSIVRYAVTQKAANDAVHAAIDGEP